jgi:uncharacterized membrane protein
MFGPQTSPADDSGLDRYIGIILRTGMLTSAAVVLLGGVLFLARQGSSLPNFHQFHGEPGQFTSVPRIVEGTIHSEALSIVQFGLLLLIATPIARVIFSVAAFLWERDYLYVVFSLLVLLVLLYSLFGFKGGG